MSNTAFNSNFVSISGGSNSIQDFRLTLVSDTPVMTTAVTAATTLYLTPYKGNSIGLYSSGAWSVLQTAQVSLSLSALSANTNYDIFAYNSSGSVAIESLAWSNSNAGTSARATALIYQDGILVKSGDATRRYIGTIRTTDVAGQCEFSFGGYAVYGTEAKLFVWNYYNRVETYGASYLLIGAYTYNSAAYRYSAGSTTYRVTFVVGLVEDSVSAAAGAYHGGNYNSGSFAGIGHNSASAVGIIAGAIGPTSSGEYCTNSSYKALPTLGTNFIAGVERTGGGVWTYYGTTGFAQTGLQVDLMM
jgi:hypothetical protein